MVHIVCDKYQVIIMNSNLTVLICSLNVIMTLDTENFLKYFPTVDQSVGNMQRYMDQIVRYVEKCDSNQYHQNVSMGNVVDLARTAQTLSYNSENALQIGLP